MQELIVHVHTRKNKLLKCILRMFAEKHTILPLMLLTTHLLCSHVLAVFIRSLPEQQGDQTAIHRRGVHVADILSNTQRGPGFCFKDFPAAFHGSLLYLLCLHFIFKGFMKFHVPVRRTMKKQHICVDVFEPVQVTNNTKQTITNKHCIHFAQRYLGIHVCNLHVVHVNVVHVKAP